MKHAVFVSAVLLSVSAVASPPYLHAPAVNTSAKIDSKGITVLPNGRFVTPWGDCFAIPQNPHVLVMSPRSNLAFVGCEGKGVIATIAPDGTPTINPIDLGAGTNGTGAGAAFSADGETLYWSGGDNGKVYVVDVASGKKTGLWDANVPVGGRKFEDSVLQDLKLSADGRWLFGADVTNFRVVAFDVRDGRVVGSIPVGRYPYALAVDGKWVHVANIGMFEYSAIEPPGGGQGDPRGLTRPAFGFPSAESKEGIVFEGRRVAGLGDPNVPDSFSVWTLDASDPAHMKTVRKVKTGLLVGQPTERGKTVGGSAPNFVVARNGFVYVSDGNNDLIQKIDTKTGQIAETLSLCPSPLVAGLRGVGPSGMALSPDGATLYVAESGINSVAVIDAKKLRMVNRIPSAWYPYRVATTLDGRRLLAICFKSFGNGPKGVSGLPKSPFLGMQGTLQFVRLPMPHTAPDGQTIVLQNNGIEDRSRDRDSMSSSLVPTWPGKPSPEIKYVVFITKENHTYDAVFDHVPGANADPALLRWGLHQTLSADGQPTLTDVPVMVNHNALARQFTVSDNFYMEPEASGVGHRWLVGVQPNNFCQMTYTLGWDFKLNSAAPGRRASFGSNGSLLPEDYPEAGAMWEHLGRFGVPFRNYGEGFEFPGVAEDDNERKTGAREVVNVPMSKVLFDNTCFDFPIFNMNIPDQYRAYWFMRDLTERYLKPGKEIPRFLNIAICNDHGTGPKPDRGYPYVASWMADNDLALGRIVEFLSHTPYWRKMLILVTEDDAGGENDHVDAQRSVLLAIGPWVKHGYVSHRHTTITSMHRTLYEILGLPPLSMWDALANDFSDCFTTHPDFTPYTVKPVDPRVFDPEKAKDPNDPDYGKAWTEPGVKRDDPEEEKKVNGG